MEFGASIQCSGRGLNMHITAALVFSAVLASACGATTVSSQAITGQVIAADTKSPVGNAYVTARWDIESASVSGHGLFCVRSVAVQTDDTGHFRLEPWERNDENAASFFADLDVYLPGYVLGARDVHLTGKSLLFGRTLEVPAQNVLIEVKRFDGDDQERSQQLDLFVTRTICQLPYMRGLHPLYEAMYREAKDLPPVKVQDAMRMGLQSRLLDLLEKTKQQSNDSAAGAKHP